MKRLGFLLVVVCLVGAGCDDDDAPSPSSQPLVFSALLSPANEVPAIAISGYVSDEDRDRALGTGYRALVPKPIDVEVLFDLIHDLKLPQLSSADK